MLKISPIYILRITKSNTINSLFLKKIFSYIVNLSNLIELNKANMKNIHNIYLICSVHLLSWIRSDQISRSVVSNSL